MNSDSLCPLDTAGWELHSPAGVTNARSDVENVQTACKGAYDRQCRCPTATASGWTADIFGRGGFQFNQDWSLFTPNPEVDWMKGRPVLVNYL